MKENARHGNLENDDHVQKKLIPNTIALRSLEKEKDTFDEYNGLILTYQDKIKKLASQVFLSVHVPSSQPTRKRTHICTRKALA